jgi:hypothetical protein
MTSTHRSLSGNTSGTDSLGRFGVTYTPERSVFRVHSACDELELRLVHPGTRELYRVRMELVSPELAIWEAEVDGNLRGWSYSYEVVREEHRLSGILDPWATLIRDHGA